MSDPIDELSQRWKRNPDAAATVALCEALRSSPRPAMVQQVGELAAQKHATDVAVLIAVARMYLDSQRLSDAQAVLVSAGKVAPREAGIYRWLGEVLLRRGDAERAEKVLERAVQLGSGDGETRLWLDRARVFRPVQAKAGARAVASEIAQAAAPAARAKLESLSDDSTTSVLITASMEEEDSISEKPTQVRDAPKLPPAGRAFSTDAATVPFPTPGIEFRAALDDALKRQTNGQSAKAPALPANRPPPPAAGSPARPAPESAAPAPYRSPEPPGVPAPKDVLQALALAGVFEPQGAQPSPMRWDRPVSPSRRGTSMILAGAMVLVAGIGVATYRYVRQQRVKQHAMGDGILATVEADLHASKAALLPGDEERIGRVFELDSRSPRAALDWLRERALVGLLKNGSDVAFEDAISRAREVGVKEEDVAFAHLASFLFQNDTAGAAALLSRWDGPSANDAWYQLLAGATLERAGDLRAYERYAAAVKLDPDLVVAQIAVVRQAAIEGDALRAGELAKQFRATYPDRVEGAALASMAWGRDPTRGDQPPPDVAEMLAHAAELPSSLLSVPHALLAIAALDKLALDDAKAEIEKGIAAADGPGMASWLGNIALDTRDEVLVRRAALAAVSFSAVYGPARVLAARVALLGDRLDEALKATEDLDSTSPDVALLRAAVAYERVDADGVSRALDAVSPEARQAPFMNAIAMAPRVLLGQSAMTAQKIADMSDDEAPWSDLVAMDLALDLGELDVADKIGQSWKGSENKPLRALRLSRLARYQNRLDAADVLSKSALEGGTVTPRTLQERVFVLVARNRQVDVAPLMAKFPLVLGPSAAWLSAYASATAGKVDEARGKTANVDIPPALAPLPVRIVAAAALGAMKDKRRGIELIKPLLASGVQDPDLVAAALALGFRKVERRR